MSANGSITGLFANAKVDDLPDPHELDDRLRAFWVLRVGPTVKRRLSKLGLGTVGDALEYRPHRYEPAAPERRITELFGEDEAVITGEVRSTRLQRARRLKLVKARVADETSEAEPAQGM